MEAPRSKEIYDNQPDNTHKKRKPAEFCVPEYKVVVPESEKSVLVSSPRYAQHDQIVDVVILSPNGTPIVSGTRQQKPVHDVIEDAVVVAVVPFKSVDEPNTAIGKKTKKAAEMPTWLLSTLQALTVILIKGKAILLGLAKIKGFITLVTMTFNVLAYWWWAKLGLPAAVGFVSLIFVHEMGHVFALRYFGINATQPLFIPFVGAVVGMKEKPKNVLHEAIVALAGPFVGSLGAVVCLAVYLLTMEKTWLWLFSIGVMINLFNLMPATPLDGGRVIGAVWRGFWFLGIAGLIGIALIEKDAYLLVIACVCLHEMLENYRRTRRTERTIWAGMGLIMFVACICWQHWWSLSSLILPVIYWAFAKDHLNVVNTEDDPYWQLSLPKRLAIGTAYSSLAVILLAAMFWVNSLHVFIKH